MSGGSLVPGFPRASQSNLLGSSPLVVIGVQNSSTAVEPAKSVLNAAATTGTGIMAVASMLYTGSLFNVNLGPGGMGDSNGGLNSFSTGEILFNETTWDRKRNNTEATLLASAVRSATVVSPDQKNLNARGVSVNLNLTAVPGVDTVTLLIQGKDPVTGGYFTLLSGAPVVVAAAERTYIVYPGAGVVLSSDVVGVESRPLPRIWRVAVVHSGAGNFTYSVAAELIL